MSEIKNRACSFKDLNKTVRMPKDKAPCKAACPAGIDVPHYVRLIAQEQFGEALAVIREKIPFPAICGHVCFHPCETKCRLAQMNNPVAIKALKRFVAERSGAELKEPKIAERSNKRVAIIGSGPAGLTAAYYLAKLGHLVTVFEALPEPGGMMRVGIPDYRLPKDILRTEIKEIESIGVEIKTSTRVDSLENLFKQGYHAIFLAIGAHQGISTGIEGEDGPGVKECVSFLRDVNLGKDVNLGDRVAVIGGGNAALDSVRTSLRLGAKEATILYRRTRDEMPASSEEIEEAIAEGVKIHFLVAPSRIISRNGELELECIRMELGAVDAGGRRRPVPIKGSEFSMNLDTLIAAVGQRPEVPDGFKVKIGEGNTIQANAETLATSRPGVWAGGDAVSGPASVIEAIAAARKAASAIDRFLGGRGAIEQTLVPSEAVVASLPPSLPIGERGLMPSVPVVERLTSFVEVELGLTEEMAIEQAKRCLWCDLPIIIDAAKCTGCWICQFRCSLSHENAFDLSRSRVKVRRLVRAENEYSVSITDQCDDCGICARYCPYGAITRGKREQEA